MYANIREYIKKLKEAEDCKIIDFSSTNMNFNDLSAILYYFDTVCHQAVLIRCIPGVRSQVLGNVYGSIQRLCAGVGINPSQKDVEKLGCRPEGSPGGMGGCGGNRAYTLDKLQRASLIMLKEKLIASIKVSRDVKVLNETPYSSNFIPSSKADLTDFCIPIQYCSGDSGAFITSGIIITKSPKNGIVNYAIRRHQIHNGQELGAFIAYKSDTMKHVKEAAKLGQKLEAAIAIGVSPAVMFAASMYVPEHIGETSAAGNLQGYPLEVVNCKTIDLQVPVCAEIILEGYIDPTELKDEGPMTEYTDCSIGKSKKNTFHLTGITHKTNPIYQTLRSGRSAEHELMLIISNWSKTEMLKNILNKEFSGIVNEVAFGAGSAASHVIIQVKNIQKREGDIILEWILKNYVVKMATIVDESVCPFNQEEVAWATFVFAGSSEDFLKFDSIFTTPVDPMSRFCRKKGTNNVCKLGINAIPPKGFTKPTPPGWNKTMENQITQLLSTA